MELLFYGVMFLVGAMFVASFVQALLHPPVEITPAELPAIVQRELEKNFPSFEPTKILFLGIRRRYTLNGSNDNRDCKLEFELKPDGELDEVVRQ